jgi:ubiquinone/menaquinone biosynthesis C-methylase UbiE
MPATERYVPAAGRARLTRLYDPVMALTVRERAFRPALVAAVLDGPRPHTVLDIGCGTGTLTAALARADPSVEVLGLDGDEQVLRIARAKNARYGERVRFTRGMADELPAQDASVDRAVASLLLHHLPREAKLRALAEARRVLRPDGLLVIADWGKPHGPLMRAAFLSLQLVDGFQNTSEHAAGRLPALVAQAGFEHTTISARWRTMWGTLEMITASPAPA